MPTTSQRSVCALLVLVLSAGCLGGQTGEPTSGLPGRCWPASEFPDQQPHVWTKTLNELELRPTNWAHPEQLPVRLTASVNENALACRASPTRTDWQIELTLASQQGTVFSQTTQVLGERVECEGCFLLHLSTIAAVENAALILDAEDAAIASETSAELNATVVGSANAATTISGNLIVRYRLDTSPGVERSRHFEF